MSLPIATRKSPLALAQAHLVQAGLARALKLELEALPILGLVSTGDKLTDRTLIEAGGKGLFTKEIDEALLNGDAAIAVHSMKDVPTRLPDGLALAAILEREDPRDVLLTADGSCQLADLPKGAILGTASLRRQAQSLALRPDLTVETLRGNVDTRLGKLRDGTVQATFLARAGLIRLGRKEGELTPCDTETLLPAAGQAAIGLVVREDDVEARQAVSHLNHRPSALAVTAERAFLAALDGSCRTPIAAHATLSGDTLHLVGEALTPDGRNRWRETLSGPMDQAEAIGRQLGQTIKAAGGDVLARAVAAL